MESEVSRSVHGGSAIPVDGGRGGGTDWDRVFFWTLPLPDCCQGFVFLWEDQRGPIAIFAPHHRTTAESVVARRAARPVMGRTGPLLWGLFCRSFFCVVVVGGDATCIKHEAAESDNKRSGSVQADKENLAYCPRPLEAAPSDRLIGAKCSRRWHFNGRILPPRKRALGGRVSKVIDRYYVVGPIEESLRFGRSLTRRLQAP